MFRSILANPRNEPGFKHGGLKINILEILFETGNISGGRGSRRTWRPVCSRTLATKPWTAGWMRRWPHSWLRTSGFRQVSGVQRGIRRQHGSGGGVVRYRHVRYPHSSPAQPGRKQCYWVQPPHRGSEGAGTGHIWSGIHTLTLLNYMIISLIVIYVNKLQKSTFNFPSSILNPSSVSIHKQQSTLILYYH